MSLAHLKTDLFAFFLLLNFDRSLCILNAGLCQMYSLQVFSPSQQFLFLSFKYSYSHRKLLRFHGPVCQFFLKQIMIFICSTIYFEINQILNE